MSTEWAIPTIEKERCRKATDKISKSANNEQRQDKRMFYCTKCKIVFQPNVSAARRFYKGNEIDIYEDFPTIGKERVDSCQNCESKSK